MFYISVQYNDSLLGITPYLGGMTMDYLGSVQEVTTEGKLVVKCTDLPEIGEVVYDAEKNKIGVVKRVFGPVSGPYASIEPKSKPTGGEKGTDLYTTGGNKHGKDKGRSRRN